MKSVSLKKNFIMNALLTMSSFIFPLITFPYVSRVLLPTGTGKVAFATNLITYFNMIAQLGIPTYGIRACAKVRDDKEELTRTAHELLMINVIMSIVSYIVLALAIAFVPRLREEKTLIVIISFTMILTAIGMEWLYKAMEQYTYITVRSIAFKFIALIAMFLLVKEEKDYVIYGAITIFAASASNILNLINAHKYIGFKPVDNYNLKRHYKPVLVFFAMACATTIYVSLNTVVLGFIKTDADVGYYDAAMKIKKILASIITSLGTVLLPRASYYIEHKQMDEFRRIAAKALNFVFIASIPMWIYFSIFAKEGIRFLSGPAYDEAIIPMIIAMPTLLLIGVSNLLGIQILVPTGREKVVLHSEIAGGIVDLILCIALIPKYSTIGAMIAMLAAEFTVTFYQWNKLKDETREAFSSIRYGSILLASALGAGLSILVKRMNLSNFVTLLISAIVFFGVYGALLLVMKEPMATEIFNGVLKKLKIAKNGER